MAKVKWIKITTTMFDDEKIRIIESLPEADAIMVIWIKLLTLAGKCNSNGFIFLAENIPYTAEMIATIFNRPLNTVRLALHTFKQFGMIDYDENNFLYLVNWGTYQNIEGLEKIREQTRKRVAAHREKQKLLPPKSNGTVTLRNAIDLDIETDLDKDKDLKDIPSNFYLFWMAYPNKKSKGQAEKAWKKIKPDEQLYKLILDKLEEAKQSPGWIKDGGQFIPHPATWLNAKGWEDQYQQIEQVPQGWNGLKQWADKEGVKVEQG